MVETKFQKLLIDIIKSEGGWAAKLSHRFSIGVPDLLVRLPNVRRLVLAECKRVVTPSYDSPSLSVKMGITPHQQKYIREFVHGFSVILTETPDGAKVRVTLERSDIDRLSRNGYELDFKPRTNKLQGNLVEMMERFCNDHNLI